MTAQLIDGKAIAAHVRQRVAEKIAKRQQVGARAPGLAVVVVGEDPASHVYVSNKHRACEQAGILSFQHALPAATTQQALEALVDQLNDDASIDGILVQLPLPAHLDANPILERIKPDKDVDGFHPYNLGLACSAVAGSTPLHTQRGHDHAGRKRPVGAWLKRHYRWRF